MVMAADLLIISSLVAWADLHLHRLRLQIISTLATLAVPRLHRLCSHQDRPVSHRQAETLCVAVSQVVFSRTVFQEVIFHNGQFS